MRFSRLSRLLTLMCTVLLLVACGGGGGGGTSGTATPVASAPDILRTASQRLAATTSMRFDLRIDGKSYIDPEHTIQLLSASGTMARPDKVDVQFKARVLGTQTVTIRMITIGTHAWTTNLLTGKWETAPKEFGYDPSILYDNQNGLGPVMGKIDNPNLVGTETVNGHEAYHVTGTATQKVIGPVTAETMVGEPIGIELWIDTATWNLLRVVLTEPKTAQNPEPATWTMNLTDHDKQVSIEPPA